MGADQGENVTCGCVDSCSFVNQPSIPSCFTLDPVRDRSLFCKESGTLCFLFLEFFLKRCFTFKNGYYHYANYRSLSCIVKGNFSSHAVDFPALLSIDCNYK